MTNYIAHNGIHHTNGLEAAGHQSNSLVWVVAGVVALALIFFVISRLGNQKKAGQKAKLDKD